MILERIDDPEESVFRLILKIEKRGGKTHPTIEQKIRDLILTKLQAEITFEEFKRLFIILFCKIVSLIFIKINS